MTLPYIGDWLVEGNVYELLRDEWRRLSSYFKCVLALGIGPGVELGRTIPGSDAVWPVAVFQVSESENCKEGNCARGRV